MTKTLMVACLAGLVSVLLIGFATQVAAADNTPWSEMHAGANAPSSAAARQQCLNAGVAAGECNSFASMLQEGKCTSVVVPDGETTYRWLGGRGGKISRNKVKALGGDTPALRCVLPSGRTLDWYHVSVTGESACNNVGEPILHLQPPQVTFSAPRVEYHAPDVVVTPGMTIELGCPACCNEEMHYLPGSRVVIPRSPSTSRRLQFE